ncbi:hemin-degrading factor [Rhodovulum euryhalinum]|uniref:Putative hemin transport protein n=1 Tax=Rhodovulum euryhalinum TaxID=35805 RepID=A0A4R2KDR0_9RHOB|nr:ChuX/HutX family heme-like substrate-binding protein [Rhodovulum euryhalinum]TCO71731.1 putative hemin transport protein [Rhodovulum euryhalinum]
MQAGDIVTPDRIRSARAEKSTMRSRDLADSLGVAEAEVLAAEVGAGVIRIVADPDALMPFLPGFGEAMALTRNDCAVIEKTGAYGSYTPGGDASTVRGPAFDLRIVPRHWVHGFAVEEQKGGKVRRSIQVFDGAGDAVHKIYLGEDDIEAEWQALIARLRLDDQSDSLALAPREPVEPARSAPGALDRLQAAWDRPTGAGDFLAALTGLGMNRLGAYRILGAPRARALDPSCMDALLNGLATRALRFALAVGNRGCTEIHRGPAETIKPTGPWLNILDPAFNLHLRADKVAEVWAVTRPTGNGPAMSVEAFDASGGPILRVSGVRGDDGDRISGWTDLVATLPGSGAQRPG